jgi:MFS superfamily sulfate permease-like transporter
VFADDEDVLLVRVEGALFYANAVAVKEQILALAARRAELETLLVEPPVEVG